MAARPRRDPLRVRARDQQVVHGELDRLVERERRIRCTDDDDDRPRDDYADRGDRCRQAGRSSTRTSARRPSPSISRLPWITGSPYALYAHVRAITSKGVTSWSDPYGFNVRWSSIPKDLNSTHPGLVRWSPVEGATAYQVWLYGAKSTFMTTTNVADARDLYTFHRTNPFFTSSIQFRVRAQRKLYGEVVSGLPVTTYGPWSPIYTDVQPPLSLGTLGDVATVSDIQSDTSPGLAHALSPGFVFSGDSGGLMDYNGGAPAELFRVYIATDEDCVNIVYRGAIVGSPAYAPRTTGPLKLPTDSDGHRGGAGGHPRPRHRRNSLDGRRHRFGDERGSSRCRAATARPALHPLPQPRRPLQRSTCPTPPGPQAGTTGLSFPSSSNRSRQPVAPVLPGAPIS